MFDPGDIMHIYYWRRTHVSSDTVMRETSKMLSEYLQNYQIKGYLGQEQADPMTAYAGFQAKSREMMEAHGTRIGIPTQVGQKESMDHIKKIATSPDFLRWEDPITVNFLLTF